MFRMKKIKAIIVAVVVLFTMVTPIAAQDGNEQGCDYDGCRPVVIGIVPSGEPFLPTDD